MKEEKKWDYNFYDQRNSGFEKQETIGVEKWEREKKQSLRLKNETVQDIKGKNL